jgi:hypothetical protein
MLLRKRLRQPSSKASAARKKAAPKGDKNQAANFESMLV